MKIGASGLLRKTKKQKKIKEDGMKEVKAWFKVLGNTAYVQFSEYLPLTWTGKRVLPLLVQKALREVGFFVRSVVFCRLEEIGLQPDKFFEIEVEVPDKLIRHNHHGFKVAETAKVSA